jgi:hypothetical protein
MYCVYTEDDHLKSVAKGVKRNKIANLKMEDYKKCLFGSTREELQQMTTFNSIRSNNHQVSSLTITKVGLSGTDDKRAVLNNNINTLAWGHYKIQEMKEKREWI